MQPQEPKCTSLFFVNWQRTSEPINLLGKWTIVCLPLTNSSLFCICPVIMFGYILAGLHFYDYKPSLVLLQQPEL